MGIDLLEQDIANIQPGAIELRAKRLVLAPRTAIAFGPTRVIDLARRKFIAGALDAFERLRTGKRNLLAQVSQTHSLGKLRYGNRVVQKRPRERKVRIVCTVSADDIETRRIDEKAIEQVVASGASDGIREIDTAICEQQSKPSEHRIFRARKVEDGELVRSKLIAIRKPIRFARARPFLCKVFMLGTIEACAVVVVWTAQLQARLLNDFGRPMPEDHGATASVSVSEVSL